MALSCGAKVCKYILFGFNLVFFLAGCVCLGIGIFLMVDEDALDKVTKGTEDRHISDKFHALYHLGIIMTIGGAIIIVISFLGCCGAVTENRVALVLYAICLMIVVALEIAAVVYAVINKQNLEKEIKKVLRDSLNSYNGIKHMKSTVRDEWDKYMSKKNCCGVESPREKSFNATNEFANNTWYSAVFLPWYHNMTHGRKCFTSGNITSFYPETCCATALKPEESGTCGEYSEMFCPKNSTHTKAPFNRYIKHRDTGKGCYDALKQEVEDKLGIVIGVGVAVGLIELFGIVFAFCLCSAISTARYYVQ